MKRTIAVVILAVAALALLVSLSLQSRSVPVEAHIAQHTVATETQRIRSDFDTLFAALSSAWQNSESPGEGARAIAASVASSADKLREPVSQIPGSAAQRSRVMNSYKTLVGTTANASALASALLDELGRYADSVSYLRENGPQIIQRMRDIRLDRVAQDTFQLIVGTLDYARPDSKVAEYDLRRLLVTLERDQRIDANMPRDVKRLSGAVANVLDDKSNIESRLKQLSQTPVNRDATNLEAAASTAYASVVAKADQAGLMLAVYAVLLLLAVGLIAFRLQGSYREINKANAELAGLNESLEQRVAERTQELEGALANLKESQVQLVQAEKMSSLGQLVAGISHEINTPLLYLANNAALIQERVQLFREFLQRAARAFSVKPEDYEKRSDYQAEFVEALRELKVMIKEGELEATSQEADDLVRDSIEGLAELTDMAQSLKDFSRLDRAPIARFDVNGGLDKTLLIAKNIVKHKADIRKFYGDVPEIECSPSQINQVFLNLITNAAQAIEEHGEIVISTKKYDAGRVAVTISDTGCGISKENLAKIRDPFFTTKEVGTGTGLGLSIVDEIVRSHGGELMIDSEVGRGSAFTVVLPIKRTEKAAAEEQSAAEDMADARPADEEAQTQDPLAEAV